MAQSVTWLGADGATVPVALRRAQRGDECAIFQLPVGEVRIDGLPAAWTDGGTFDVAELRCAHRFHPCALALHFAANDMRCPVCRQGPPARLAVPSVSRAMQPALAAKAAELCAPDAADLEVEVDLHELLRDLTLQVEIIWDNAGSRATRTVLRTPLRCDAVDTRDAAPDSRETYTTHRSFQRLFNSNVRRAQAHAAEFRFSLLHPLLPYTLRSPIFDGACMRGVDIPLAHGVGALRVHTDPGPGLLDLRVNTQFLLMMCVQHVMRQYEHLLA